MKCPVCDKEMERKLIEALGPNKPLSPDYYFYCPYCQYYQPEVKNEQS
jgi:hypothetical protein